MMGRSSIASVCQVPINPSQTCSMVDRPLRCTHPQQTAAIRMVLKIPSRLSATCRETPERSAWLNRLPEVVASLRRRWSLRIDAPFENDVSCAWVAPAVRADGLAVVLKVGMPHMESRHEIEGLRFWNGHPTVRLLEYDTSLNAMVLERCAPGSSLRTVPEAEQDVVIAGLLRRIWRTPPPHPHPFRPLSVMTAHWFKGWRPPAHAPSDAGLLREGLSLFEELPRTAPVSVMLATDLHAGNVLRARREPWLAIDPKPFVGDPAYDATQHLLNCGRRLRSDPDATIRRFADLLGVNDERIRLWTFARSAIEYGSWDPDGDWSAFLHKMAP